MGLHVNQGAYVINVPQTPRQRHLRGTNTTPPNQAVHRSSRLPAFQGGAVTVAFGDVMYHAERRGGLLHELQPVPPESRNAGVSSTAYRLRKSGESAPTGRSRFPSHWVFSGTIRGTADPESGNALSHARSPSTAPLARRAGRRVRHNAAPAGSPEPAAEADAQVALLQALSPAASAPPGHLRRCAGRPARRRARSSNSSRHVVLGALLDLDNDGKSGSWGRPGAQAGRVAGCSPARPRGPAELPFSTAWSTPGPGGAHERRRSSTSDRTRS